MFLRSVTLLKEKFTDFQSYPFTVPAIRCLESLHFDIPVTFFVGENGSGKSTLLEAIAYQCGFNTAGGGRNNAHEVDSSHAALGDFIRLSWMPKVTQGFFLRAESFYHFASHLDQLAREDPTFHYQGYGSRSLHQQFHGESFLSLISGGNAQFIIATHTALDGHLMLYQVNSKKLKIEMIFKKKKRTLE